MLRIYVKVPPEPVETVVPDNIKDGALYNWYSIQDARNVLSSDDFFFLTQDQIVSYLGTYNPMLIIDPLMGGGRDETNGTFVPNTVSKFFYINSTDTNPPNIVFQVTGGAITGCYVGSGRKKRGVCARPCRLTTIEEALLPDGLLSQLYIGNDLKAYQLLKQGIYVFLNKNLAETKYRNGDTIPEVTDNAAWAVLTTGALCAYNNDWSNV